MVDLMTGPNLTKLYIPVTINDSIYPFLFDAGSSINIIDSGLNEKIGLTKEAIINLEMKEVFGTVRNDSAAYAYKTCAIGNLNVTTPFFLNGYEGLFFKSSFNEDMKESLVGLSLMLNFNWLFNFANSTVTASYTNVKILIPDLPDDKILTLDFYTESDLTLIDVTMDGMTFKDVLFDTGCEHNALFAEKSKSMDILFSKSDFEELIRNNPELPSLGIQPKTGETLFIIDSLQINDCTMQGILAQECKDDVQTIFTAQFVRRFRMMHYDSANRKIQLYVSPSDSARHHRRDLQNLLRAMLQYRPSNERGEFDVPVDIINNNLE